MSRSVSDGIIAVALGLTWVAAVWVVIDLLLADPAILVFEDIAIGCAVLAPILCLLGWGVRGLGRRSGAGRAVRRA